MASVVARGRTCSLDLGRARIGVAIDDDLGSMAHPRGTLDPRDRKLLFGASLVFVLLILAAMIFGGEAGRSGDVPSTYSTASGGAKAAYLLLLQSGYNVERWEKPLLQLPPVAGQTLILAEPESFFEEEMELDEAVEDIEPLSFLLGRLLDQLCARLVARALSAAAIHLRFDLGDIFEYEAAPDVTLPPHFAGARQFKVIVAGAQNCPVGG